jgi:hypothetical protein
LRECNRKPKEGLGVRSTPGFSECAAESSMTRSALIVLMIALSSSGAPSLAQTTQFDAPLAAPAKTDDVDNRLRQGDEALRIEVGVYEEHAHAAPPPDPPAKDVDVTVGLGSSVDRAPRDIREPFDE